MFRTFGPWALVLGCMALMLKYLVVDKLNAIMAKLAKVDEHETEIKLIRQALKMNGCLDGDPRCKRA